MDEELDLLAGSESKAERFYSEPAEVNRKHKIELILKAYHLKEISSPNPH